MIWVAWRQHRTESFVVLGVLVLIGIFLLITGLNMAHDFQQSGLSDCLARSKPSDICGPLGTAFLNQYGSLILVAVALLILPILLGALVGAPLVARESEQRTNLLVWLQSITRTHWLIVKLVLVLGIAPLPAGVVMVLLIWWYRPVSQLIGSFKPAAVYLSRARLIP